MNIKPVVTFTYTLNMDDLKEAVRDYINKEGGVVGEDVVLTITPRMVTHQSHAPYPSDSFDIDVFDGVDVRISNRK